MIPRTIADIGSGPDIVIGAAIILVAVFIAVKLVGMFSKLIVLILVAIGIYVWAS